MNVVPAMNRPIGRCFDETARQIIALRCAAAALRIPPSPTPSYNPLPDLDRLRSLFEYEPDNGRLINRVARGGLKVGDVAGLRKPEKHAGYVTVYVDCKPYRAHRVAWKMATGRDPVGMIDHVNGDKADNRFANLREATALDNARNRHKSTGAVPVVGVSIDTRSGLYAADIGAGNRIVHLGKYDRLECAAAARRYAEAILFDLPGDRRVA